MGGWNGPSQQQQKEEREERASDYPRLKGKYEQLKVENKKLRALVKKLLNQITEDEMITALLKEVKE